MHARDYEMLFRKKENGFSTIFSNAYVTHNIQFPNYFETASLLVPQGNS